MRQCGIAVDRGDHPLRRAAHRRAAGADRVGADVIERAAALVRIVADVVRVEELLRQRALHGARGADRARRKHFGDLRPLRMVAIGERLLDVPAAPVARRDQGDDIGSRQAKRLLAQHVLARREGPRRPLDVQVVGQRHVQRVDPGIVDQRVVGIEVARDAEFLRQRLRLVGAARRDADQGRGRRPCHRRDEPRSRDRRPAEDAPSDRIHRHAPVNARAIAASSSPRRHAALPVRPRSPACERPPDSACASRLRDRVPRRFAASPASTPRARAARTGQHVASDRPRAIQRLAARHDFVDEAHPPRLVRGHALGR